MTTAEEAVLLASTILTPLVAVITVAIVFYYSRKLLREAVGQSQLVSKLIIATTNEELSHRLMAVRGRVWQDPELASAVMHELPELEQVVSKVGGRDTYILYRDSIDVVQDVFLLHKRGVVSDEYWDIWKKNPMKVNAALPGLPDVFAYLCERDLLVPEFSEWYRKEFIRERPEVAEEDSSTLLAATNPAK